MRHPSRLLPAALAVAALAASVLPAAASADMMGADDSIATAFGPLVPGTLYSGAFRSDADTDYLAFDVAKAGDLVHFDVANLTPSCPSPDANGCPVYATLIDSSGQQVGGEGSGAGTGAVTVDAHTDVVDWTFGGPGRFYVAMDSGVAGTSYSIRLRPPAAVAPVVKLLKTSLLAHGRGVKARLGFGTALRSAKLTLKTATGAILGVTRLAATPAGTRTVTVRLSATGLRQLTKKGSLAVTLRVAATPVSGTPLTVTKALRLRR
jgi:hypothetical protein